MTGRTIDLAKAESREGPLLKKGASVRLLPRMMLAAFRASRLSARSSVLLQAPGRKAP
jgi:hypothetical protein